MSDDKDPVRRRFSVEFPRAIKECEIEYDRHYPKKGATWQTCDLRYLEDIFFEAIIKLRLLNVHSKAYTDQLIDIVNIGLMIIERRKKVEK